MYPKGRQVGFLLFSEGYNRNTIFMKQYLKEQC